ncbi:MAG: MTH1187 family thiamine-binding protein [Acidobacteriota bacterium]
MVIAEVSIIPIGSYSTSVSDYVTESVKVLKNYKNLNYQITSMGTILEGEFEDILKALEEMHEAQFKFGAKRVVTKLTVDDRRDKEISMEAKVKSVVDKLK